MSPDERLGHGRAPHYYGRGRSEGDTGTEEKVLTPARSEDGWKIRREVTD